MREVGRRHVETVARASLAGIHMCGEEEVEQRGGGEIGEPGAGK